MKMFRKFISFATMAALMVSAGSCQKEITDGIDDGGAKVSLTLQTVDQQTRAIADASNIDILHWEIYPEDVLDAAKPLAKGSERDTDGDGVFTLDLSLILDQTYNFIFWAQVDPEEGKEHYDVSDLRRVGIKTYDDEKANDESRAAFFAYETIHVSGSIEETITLYRPFSQLNLGTETYDVSSLNLTESLKVNYSEVTAYGIADTFNTITGEGEGSREVHFQQNITPNGDEDAVKKILEVNNTSYYWLGMNYLIVNGNSDNVKVDMKFHTTHGEVELSIDNVPIKENYRTNIIGDLLTSEAFFKIVVDEKFQTPDYIVGDEGGSEEGGGSGEEPGEDPEDPDNPDNPGGNTPGEDDKDHFEVTQEGEVVTYTVYTAKGLEAWRAVAHANDYNTSKTKYNLVLAADIELPVPADGQSNWTPVGTTGNPYDGIVDGGGFTISNLTIIGGSNVGFIGAANYDGVVVSNLSFENVNISASKNVGTVIGQTTNGGSISNCHVLSGNVTGTDNNVGGILGYRKEYGAVTNSTNYAEISGVNYVGGIAGYAYGSSCTNYGNVTATGSYVGGIYGEIGSDVGKRSGNKNYGDVSGKDYVGGIAGKGGETDAYNEGKVTGKKYVGGISGSFGICESTLENCVNEGEVTGDDYVGGITGDMGGRCNITKAENRGKVNGDQYVGGIIGSFGGSSKAKNLTYCKNTAEVTGKTYVGGILGYSTGSIKNPITGNINEADITGEDKVAGIVGYNNNSIVTANTNSGNISGYTHLGQIIGEQNASYSPDTVTGNISNGSVTILENSDFTRTVHGTTVSYIVYTQRGFEAWVAEAHKSVEDGFACNLTLETDIVLPAVAEGESNWTPIGNYEGTNKPNDFKGNIDGKNHTISNLTIKNGPTGTGFIGYITSGYIKNLNFINADIKGDIIVGVIAGWATVPIENCNVLSGSVYANTQRIGGIAGYCSKTITACTNYASISHNENYSANSYGHLGGIVGEGNVVDCENYGTVTSCHSYIGGCVGAGEATNSKNYGNITDINTSQHHNSYIGGVIGSGNANNCINTGNVVGINNVGGITGSGNVTGCNNSGNVNSTGSYVGGCTGTGGAVSSSNSGTVTGKTYVGGISASVTTDIVSDCQNTGDVIATGDYVGGIAGRHTNNSSASKATEFAKCENTGVVTSSGNYVGGIVGESNSGYCVIKESINRGAVSGKDYVGGIAGSSKSVNDCENYGDVAGNQSVGGISGAKYDAAHSISGSENKGTVTGVSYLGGIVGFADAGTVTGNTHSGKVSGQDKVGGIVGYNEEDAVTYNTHAGAAEALTNVAAIVAYQDPSYSPDIVTGNVDNGTETLLAPTDYTREVNGSDIYYKVYTASGLLTWMQEAAEGASSNSKIVHLELMADVTLPADAVWTPIGRNYYNYTIHSYKGNVDGHGHTISNLTINAETNQAGFIGSLAIGTVKNLKFANVNVSSTTSYTGVIVGYNRSGTIENCHVLSGTISSTNTYTGGIVGYGPTDAVSVTNCTNAAVISSTSSNVGGIAGRSAVDNCKNKAPVSGTSHIGGITGNGNVNDSENIAAVTGTREYVGGISAEGNVARSKNYGDVATANTRDRVGGITAYGDVTDSENTGNVSGKNNLGGITGQGGAVNCTNTGDVTSHGNQCKTGGISGYSKKDISNCTNSGNVSGQNDMGGIVGYIEGGKVSSCENSGSVTGWRDTGGIAGYSSVNIEQCTNRGKVVSTSAYVGGIAGRLAGAAISGCQNYAEVTSTNTSVGGLAGYVTGTASVSSSYNEGRVQGNDQVGGLIGYMTEGTVSQNENKGDVYYVKNTYVGLLVGRNTSATIADDNIAGGQLVQVQ